MTKWRTSITSLVAPLLGGIIAIAQKDGNVRRPPYPAILAMENVKEILLLMDTNKNGTISKEEWTRFMAAEFDRLDPGKTGAIDPKQLAITNERMRRIRFNDLGK